MPVEKTDIDKLKDLSSLLLEFCNTMEALCWQLRDVLPVIDEVVSKFS